MDKKYNREYALNKAKEFIAVLIKHNFKISAVYLFGSFASDDVKDFEWSDIDLAIISNDFTGSRFDDNMKIFPFLVKIEPRIETHPYTQTDFDNSPFAAEEIVSKGIKIEV